jgi:hypothetical protein
MEPEGSLPHSQVPATRLYPEPAQSSPHPHIPLPDQSISPCPRLCLWIFRNENTFSRWVVSPSPNPQPGGPPLVDCPRLLNQYIRSYPLYWRPFLHPQPEDAPCRGDRDALITWVDCDIHYVYFYHWHTAAFTHKEHFHTSDMQINALWNSVI